MFWLNVGRQYLWFLFFFNETATTEIYTLSLHDALPISPAGRELLRFARLSSSPDATTSRRGRSEEHTSELQSHSDIVCRLLLENKTPGVGDVPRLVKATEIKGDGKVDLIS